MQATTILTVVALSLTAHTLSGCQVSSADVGGISVQPGVPVGPDDQTVGVACSTTAELPLRRLSNAEYQNTVTDLIGDPELVAEITERFSREPTALGFRNQASSLQVNDGLAQQFQAAAETFAPKVVDASFLSDAAPCPLDAPTSACIQQFVTDFGARAYRRPLNRDELVRYSELYNTVLHAGGGVREALERVTAMLLSSSNFLFRIELPDDDNPLDYVLASRLSYLLWQTMPDTTLFDAAAAGELHTREQIQEQVGRMVRDPKSARVYEFFEQWLDVDQLGELQRSETVYPDFDEHLRALFQAETKSFVSHLLSTGGTFRQLLTAEYTFANRELAQHYGLRPLPEGDTFARVEAPGRAGVLTQAPMLIHDHPYRTSVVRRGLAIRTGLLCQVIPAPPDNVNITLPELDGELSQRDRLQEHLVDPSCSGCHALLDPIGLVFEGFDALGRARTIDEGGAAVTSNGSLVGTRDADGDYSSVREMAVALASSDEARQCFVRQAFRFFYGRDTTPEDSCTRDQLERAFAEQDFRLSDLLLGLVDTDLFLKPPLPSAAATSMDTPEAAQ